MSPTKPCDVAKQLKLIGDLELLSGLNNLFEGHDVESWSTQDGSGRSYDVIRNAFAIDVIPDPEGALARASSICRGCPANAVPHGDDKVVGCVGFLCLPTDWLSLSRVPDHELTREQKESPISDYYDAWWSHLAIWEAIRRLNLEERFRQLFHVTTPLIFGLWLTSPLSGKQAALLLEIFKESKLAETHLPIQQLIAGLRHSVEHNIPMHLQVSAPVLNEVLPHCPQCKVETPRCPEPVLGPITCDVCGFEYIAKPLSSEGFYIASCGCGDHSGPPPPTLEERFGTEAAAAFRSRYLARQGCTARQIEELSVNSKNNLLSADELDRAQKRASVHRRFRFSPANKPAPALKRLNLSINPEVSLELALIPAGEFEMGVDRDDITTSVSSTPKHRVQVRTPFYLGRTPVTQAQWFAVMGTNPSHHRGDPELPVDSVSWRDAWAFCEALFDRVSRAIRLPTEAEWEYACRAGSESAFSFGESFDSSLGNCLDRFGTGLGETTPVGRYAPNPWGLFDMHGNVQEWCVDFVHPSYAMHDFHRAPTDSSAWFTTYGTQNWRIVRGGSCEMPSEYCRSHSRMSAWVEDPSGLADGQIDPDRCTANRFSRGFRIACDIPGLGYANFDKAGFQPFKKK